MMHLSNSDPVTILIRRRGILASTTLDEVRKRYAGSVVGLVWLVLSPLLLMALYTLIYLVIFRIRPAAMSPAEYVLYILSGLMPFLGFAEALNAGTTSLSANKAVLLNTVFPAELVPMRAVLAVQGTTVVGLASVLLAAVALGKLHWTLLLVPVVWALLVLFVAGIVWVLSLANLVLRDIQQALTFVSMTLLVISPIAYTADMVTGPLRILVFANPLSYFIISLQEIVVFGRLPELWICFVTVGLAVMSFLGGFWVFQRAKRVFFDYA